jgi:ankyrin repeat protein
MEMVKYLVEERKVDVNCKEYGIPAICSASASGNNKVIEYLLSVGANINARNTNGDNALHKAASSRKNERIESLTYGQQPMGENIIVETVKLLVSRGCDFNAKNNSGQTPLEVAQKSSFDAVLVIEYLKLVQK